MDERWVCPRCYTSAAADAATCPNCGLPRSSPMVADDRGHDQADAPSADVTKTDEPPRQPQRAESSPGTWIRARSRPAPAKQGTAGAAGALGWLPSFGCGIVAVVAIGFIAAGVVGLLPFDLEPLIWAAFVYIGLGILAIVGRSLIRFARGDRSALRNYWEWLSTKKILGTTRGYHLDPSKAYVARGMVGAALAGGVGVAFILSAHWVQVALGSIGAAALLVGVGLVPLSTIGFMRVRSDSLGGRARLATLGLAGLTVLGMALTWLALSGIFPQ